MKQHNVRIAHDADVRQASENAIRTHLEHVLGGFRFSRKPRLAPLLRYVVEETLAGRRPTEYSIAIDVFLRENFQGGEQQAIVRTQMAYLRKALDEYYENEGSADAIRIIIPKGSYLVEVRSSLGTPRPSEISPRFSLADSCVIAGYFLIEAKITVQFISEEEARDSRLTDPAER